MYKLLKATTRPHGPFNEAVGERRGEAGGMQRVARGDSAGKQLECELVNSLK